LHKGFGFIDLLDTLRTTLDMADKIGYSQLPILNLVVLLLTCQLLGNNEDVPNFFDLKFRMVED